MEIQVQFTEADKKCIREGVVRLLIEELRKIAPDSLRKHAYTVKEVAKQISYSTKTVLGFIHNGRTARNGKTTRLNAKEITPGDYRILPADLDRFLSNF